MNEYINKLKEIETLVELAIDTTMTEERATDIYAITNDLMSMVKKNNPVSITNSNLFKDNLNEYLNSKVTGGLYGLTISDEDFLTGLINVINLGFENKEYIAPIIEDK